MNCKWCNESIQESDRPQYCGPRCESEHRRKTRYAESHLQRPYTLFLWSEGQWNVQEHERPPATPMGPSYILWDWDRMRAVESSDGRQTP